MNLGRAAESNTHNPNLAARPKRVGNSAKPNDLPTQLRLSGMRLSIQTVTITGVLALIALAITAYVMRPPESAVLLRSDDPVVVSRGMEVYGQACASCHGNNLEGQPDWRQRNTQGFLPAPPHDDSGHTWHHSDEVLFDLTKNGL